MDGADLSLICLCGYENFERVTVPRRAPLDPYVTDFVACVGCKAVYWSPLPRKRTSSPPADRMMAIGGPDPNYKGPLFHRQEEPPRTLTSGEELALREIRAVAARANKSKKRR